MSEEPVGKDYNKILKDVVEVAKFVICPPLYAGYRIYKFFSQKEQTPPVKPPE